MRYWESKWVNHRYESKVLNHVRIREALKILLEFKLEFECFYDKTTVKEIDDESTKDESTKKPCLF